MSRNRNYSTETTDLAAELFAWVQRAISLEDGGIKISVWPLGSPRNLERLHSSRRATRRRAIGDCASDVKIGGVRC